MAIETYEANTFSMIITWTLAGGAAKDLTGATVEADARNLTTGAVIDLTAEVTHGPAGKVRISAPAFTFDPSVYDLQVVATKDGVTRTYAERITVRDSIKEAS